MHVLPCCSLPPLSCEVWCAHGIPGTTYNTLYTHAIYAQVEYDGPKNDIWGLGCVIYELSALKAAFSAFNMEGLVRKVRSEWRGGGGY